jgi:hypothetical protein
MTTANAISEDGVLYLLVPFRKGWLILNSAQWMIACSLTVH